MLKRKEKREANENKKRQNSRTRYNEKPMDGTRKKTGGRMICMLG